ncbi:MAG: hypothetical protein E7033_08105 [Akkermansiaceae bacterium]|nr:hypothetical protein [Akkermansiaceae bacterium]
MNKTIIISLLAALPVLAQQESPATKDMPVPPNAPQARHWGAAGEMPQRPDRKDFHKKMLEKFDTDQDGQLSDTEKEAMKAEMQKHREKGHNRPNAPHGPRGNNEGRPSREDFQKKMLEKFDADQDGQLSDTEKEAMKAEMQKHRGKGHPGKRGQRGPRPDKDGNAPATLEL